MNKCENVALPLREFIHEKMRGIALQHKMVLSPLSDELPLLESGLDSLGVAILVASLDEEFDLDPFASNGGIPVTLGDFIRMYERAAV